MFGEANKVRIYNQFWKIDEICSEYIEVSGNYDKLKFKLMDDNHKDLEFLALKSKELVDRQITSYRQHHTNSGILITILALFIPYFLNGLEDSYKLTKILSIFPIVLIIWAIVCLIQVLRSKPLFQGANFKLIDELANETYENILLKEIGANKDSFHDNEGITEKYNRKYNLAIKLTLFSIILSTLLLFCNQFNKPNKEPIFVTISNPKIMAKKKEESKKNTDEKTESKPREIPKISQEYRVTLNKTEKRKKPE